MTRDIKTVGIYLAAGYSRRMGRSKLNLPLGDTLLGCWALRTALSSRLSRMIVVVHSLEEAWLKEALAFPDHERITVVQCDTSHLGMAETLKCGVRNLLKEEKLFMVLLADQPFLSAATIERLMVTYENHTHPEEVNFIASRYDKIPRPPILFHSRMSSMIAQLHGDIGAREWIRKVMPDEGIYIDVNPLEVIDIDAPDQYDRAVQRTAIQRREFDLR